MSLEGKNILLGISGSIAAYKAVELASLLRKARAEVHVVLTESARQFITPLTLSTISRHPVHTELFNMSDWKPEHTALADAADLFVVAPATANVLAKFAYGIADDLLSTLLLAIRCPVLIAPAMNVAMYENPVVQENIARLKARGVVFSDPEYGMLADGYEGMGRLRQVSLIFEDIRRLADATRIGGDYAGKRVVVTAGPTREYLDPVRFLSNRSSGKMGYAIAEEATKRGAEVTLVSGPTASKDPANVRVLHVQTAREMRDATVQAAENADIVVLAAAVADFEPAEVAAQKIKKVGDTLTLTLRKTPDIAAELGSRKGNRILVGFAAETEHGVENARKKLVEKNLDLIVLNDVTREGAGFDADTNIVTFLYPDGRSEELSMMSKRDVAARILDVVTLALPSPALR